MSLATRITLLVVCLLALSALVAGSAIHRLARRSLESNLGGRLGARLAWLSAAVEFEEDDGELQLEPGNEPVDLAEYWQVRSPDGRVLWTSGPAAASDVVWQKRTIVLGNGDAPALKGHEIAHEDGPRQTSQARPPN